MRKSVKFTVLAFSALLFLAGCSQKPKAIELFNGKNLDGWIGYLDDSSLDTGKEFTVNNGVIHLSGKLGYIHTEKTYSNYKLEVEWRWPEKATNSGIFQRVQPEYQALPECYECQLMAGNAGDLYAMAGCSTAETRASGTNGMKKLLPSNEKPVGEWNKAEITCDGGNITIYINGELQNKATGASLAEGYVGLQSEGEAVEFRNVRLTPIE